MELSRQLNRTMRVGVVLTFVAPAFSYAAAPAPVTIENTPARRIAYLPHDGPYWSSGPVFNRVGEIARARPRSTRLVALYDLDTQLDLLAATFNKVGFELGPDEIFSDSFSLLELPSATSATTSVEGSIADIRPTIARLLQWVDEHRYEAAGPLSEIHPATSRWASDLKPWKVILEIPIRRKRTEHPTVTESASTGDTTEPRGDFHPADRVADAWKDSQPNVPRDLATANQSLDTVVPALNDEPAQVIGQEQIEGPCTPSISELVHDGEINAIVDRILSDSLELTIADRHWLNQVLLRIRATSKGIEQVYGKRQEPLSELAETLLLQFRSTLPQEDFQGKQVMSPSSKGADPSWDSKTAILDDLSRMMAGISSRRLSSEAAQHEITVVLSLVEQLLRKDENR